ncbi:MAG: YrdB family protein [Acidimicrobiia bacterium]
MFGFHPVNLVFRFALEIAALVAIALGGYAVGSGVFAWIPAIALPLVAGVVWGTFNVPGDRSRSGEAPVAVSGIIRLVIELGVFVTAVVLVSFLSPFAALLLGVAVTLHYLLSIDRIRWLLRN